MMGHSRPRGARALPAPPPLPPVLTGHVSSLPPVLTGHVSFLPPVLTGHVWSPRRARGGGRGWARTEERAVWTRADGDLSSHARPRPRWWGGGGFAGGTATRRRHGCRVWQRSQVCKATWGRGGATGRPVTSACICSQRGERVAPPATRISSAPCPACAPPSRDARPGPGSLRAGRRGHRPEFVRLLCKAMF